MILTIPPKSIPSLEDAAFEPIWSVYIKDDDIQVERPFTPLEGVNSEGQMRFWVKKYESGEVGRWLHSKKAGETIEIRGPLKTWSWRADEWDEIIMVGNPHSFPRCAPPDTQAGFSRHWDNAVLSTHPQGAAQPVISEHEDAFHTAALLPSADRTASVGDP